MKIEKFSKIKNCHCVRVSFFGVLWRWLLGFPFFFVAQDNNKGDRLVGPPIVT